MCGRQAYMRGERGRVNSVNFVGASRVEEGAPLATANISISWDHNTMMLLVSAARPVRHKRARPELMPLPPPPPYCAKAAACSSLRTFSMSTSPEGDCWAES